MRYYMPFFLAILLISFISCKKNQTTSSQSSTANVLKDSIVSEQGKIKVASDNIDVQMATTVQTYSATAIQNSVQQFDALRTDQKATISSLGRIDPADTGNVVEMIVCGDFEDPVCFIDNWDIIKGNNNLIATLDSSVSYNNSSSLYLSSPFDSTRFNQAGMSLTSYIKGITDSTVYKIRFWAKYNGNTKGDNSPSTSVTIQQDGKFMEEFPLGIDNGSYLNEDWQWYSFQVITTSASPLQIVIYSSIQNCWIDDLHIVKK